ncbi:cation/H(+) antiporter 15-like [Actinidia eriantha]|uniref:cation/H(+) antiporter 15-like n=1 Tax=Actinidia eriantha TaxID=165200 RepID=UPI0025889087|nr:cation/H(+) antiporter 15-like [Actinidia eriantha]
MGNPELEPMMTAPGLLANETVCYSANMITGNGVFGTEDPLSYSLPLFLFQFILIILTTRFVTILLKPLNVSRVFCELLAGIILGPSVMGRWYRMDSNVFPKFSIPMLETVANIGILYFVFMIGLGMEFSVIRKNGKKALAIASVGIFLPFIIGCAFSFFLHNITVPVREDTFTIFFSVALSATAFPVVMHMLAELRLLDMEIGKIAMSVALINDAVGLTLLIFGTSLAESQTPLISSLWIILTSIVFIIFCVLAVRPAIVWLARKNNPDEESLSTFTVPVILAGVMILGVTTDAIGVHPIFGAFVFALVFPRGPLQVTLVEKLEDFVTGFLLPLFFVTVGFKTNVSKIHGGPTWVTLILAIVLSFVGKVAGTVLVALIFKMPFHEGIALGLLMNSKGLVELIGLGLNHGTDHNVINDTTYAIMGVIAIFMNGIIKPLLVKIYRPTRKYVPYKRRTVQKAKADDELRILVCIHTPRNVPTIISLLEASHPATKKSPMFIFSLHVVELTGHGSSILIAHNTRESERPVINRVQAQSDHIINAFETFAQHTSFVTVQSFTSISPYSTMHEEVCHLAEDNRTALIVVPFHKQPMVDGGMEAPNSKIRMLNQNVLANAPCSVGILVDRGLTESKILEASHVSHNVAVLFFGGPDDREALSYGVRMSKNAGITLNVIRFLPGPEAEENAITMDPSTHDDRNEHGILTMEMVKEIEKQLDDDYIKEVRRMKMDDESFSYIEKVVNNGDETVSAIKSLDNIHDLYIVGRGKGILVSPLTAGLTEWSECPELGVIGDLLASDFVATVSVLVVQQYMGVVPHDEVIGTPNHVFSQQQQQQDHCIIKLSQTLRD